MESSINTCRPRCNIAKKHIDNSNSYLIHEINPKAFIMMCAIVFTLQYNA